MLATEFLHGQGMGNQLFCYVTTRMLAHRLGYDFGIKGLKSAGDSRVNQKGFYFMDLDYGKEVPDDLERYDEYRHALKTCLLYTSPSPRDRQKSRMPSSA